MNNPQYIYSMYKLSKVYPGGKQVIKDMSLSEHDLDDEVAGAIWYWLDHQSHSKQWEIIEQFGKVRPLELVLNVWEK